MRGVLSFSVGWLNKFNSMACSAFLNPLLTVASVQHFSFNTKLQHVILVNKKKNNEEQCVHPERQWEFPHSLIKPAQKGNEAKTFPLYRHPTVLFRATKHRFVKLSMQKSLYLHV